MHVKVVSYIELPYEDIVRCANAGSDFITYISCCRPFAYELLLIYLLRWEQYVWKMAASDCHHCLQRSYVAC